ncbi:MAG TPA: hypothetical protein VEB39_06335 [Sphingomicrobium sp.]|nr:hypothetical protein [Sphingomicrobium sp.]
MQNQRTNELILGAAIVALLVLLGLTAISVAPAIQEWDATERPAGDETPLQLSVTSWDRRKMDNGNDLVKLEGRIANPTDRGLLVPALTAELRGWSGKVIHKWIIAPPVTQLDAHQSVEFRDVELDVPPDGDQLTVTIGSPNN